MRALLVLLALVSASAIAQAPDWQPPPPGTYPATMSITGVVQVSGRELRSRDDRVAAFLDGEVRGVAAPTIVGNRRMFFLLVAGDSSDGTLSFRAYDALESQVHEVQPSLAFDPLVPVGNPLAPVVWTPFVGGGPPAWDVDPSDFPASMTVTGQVTEAGEVVGESGVLVAAFLDGEVRGVAPLQDAGAAGPVVFLQAYGHPEDAGDLAFRVYRPSRDRTFAVGASVPFATGTGVGVPESPAPLPLRLGRTLAGPEGWQMLAPPGASATVETVLGHLWTQGFPGAGAGHGAPNVLRYTETAGGYEPVGSAGEAWPRGEGRLVYVYADDNPRTPPEDGGFPKTLPPVGLGPVDAFTFGMTRTPGNGEPLGAGWNMLGNPFDDPIDWDLGWTRTNIAGSVFVWDPAYMGGGYRVWNGTTGSLADGIISRGSGFWARLTAADGELTVPASARVGALVPRGEAPPSAFTLRLLLRSEARPALGAEAWLSFQDAATDGLDAADAWALAPLGEDYVAFGTVSSEADRLLAVDARSPDVSGSLFIPLAVGAIAGGEPVRESLVLTWPALDVPDAWHLALADTETGMEVDLREASEYRFEAAPGARASRGPVHSAPTGSGPGVVEAGGAARFVLHVSSGNPTGSSPESAGDLDLAAPVPNPSRGTASVAFTLDSASDVHVVLVDVLGRRVAMLASGPHAAGRHVVRVSVEHLPPGTYSVRLHVGGTTRSRVLTVLR